jgi:hypothetical protein
METLQTPYIRGKFSASRLPSLRRGRATLWRSPSMGKLWFGEGVFLGNSGWEIARVTGARRSWKSRIAKLLVHEWLGRRVEGATLLWCLILARSGVLGGAWRARFTAPLFPAKAHGLLCLVIWHVIQF